MRIELAGVFITAIALIVLGEMGYLTAEQPFDANQLFVLECVSVIVTLIAIPLGLKLFELNTTHNLRRLNKDEALTVYHQWSIVRLAIIETPCIVGFIFYYLTLNVTFVLCACISLVAIVFFCLPSRKKIDIYLDCLNNDE